MQTVEEAPRATYEIRLRACRQAARSLERKHRTLGYAKLGAIAVALILGFASFLWVPLAVILFVVLSVMHSRVIRERDHHWRAAAFYEKGIGRLDGRWPGTGEPGERFLNAEHPYAGDLDLFGKGSLFELLCAARTSAGQELLAQWLCEPAPPAVVRGRQAAIAELRSRLDFREDLAVTGEEVSTGAQPEKFIAWAARPVLLASPAIRIAAGVLTLFALYGIVAWAGWGVRLPAVAAVLINGTFWLKIRRQADEAADEAENAALELRLLSLMLERIEGETFSTPLLAELRKKLDVEGHAPSNRIASLHRLVEMLESRHNWLIRLIDPWFFWTFHWSYATELWRMKSGPSARQWLAVVAEVEALCSLACHSFEHPGDPFPDIVSGEPCFDAEGLSHPLLSESHAVRNQFSVGGGKRLLVVSGSNMSGKSTLLRAVGVNAVLAQCGAPVRATRLRMTPLAAGASINVLDSLQTGTSRFYAEIKRIRQIVDLTNGSLPVLFLLDELLQGTNSHDRRIGAEAIARSLYRRDAIGLLTTHDLALAEIVDAIGPAAANVHFEDTLENGELHFDYRLRPGVVTRSNALFLMRSIGLDV